jgi:hypothetical protein
MAYEKASAYSLALARLRLRTAPEVDPAREAERAFLEQEAGNVARSLALYRKAIAGLVDSDARGVQLGFRERDAIERGHLEAELEACERLWRRAARLRCAENASLPMVAERLFRGAEETAPASAAILRIRQAQIAYLLAESGEGRRNAVEIAVDALARARGMQHAEAQGAAVRFLLRCGRLGRKRLQGVWSEPRLFATREWPKLRTARVQGWLPRALYPLKMQGFPARGKMILDRIHSRRVRVELESIDQHLRSSLQSPNLDA